MPLLVRALCLGPVETNCYIVGCPDEREGVVIDPADAADRILAVVRKEGLAIRAVRIRPRTVLRVRAADLNVVLQRLDGAGYDLIVATNILVYYDLFEQCLALKNVERMLRPGGLLLSNNALLELPSSGVRSVGYLTTVYSSRADDGDHIVWYQKGRD